MSRPLPEPRAIQRGVRLVLSAAGLFGYGVNIVAGQVVVAVRRGDDPAVYLAALEAAHRWRARYVLVGDDSEYLPMIRVLPAEEES